MDRLYGALGILLLLGLWEAGHRAYGSLVLPGLDDTARALVQLGRDGVLVPALAATAAHAGLGWLAGALAGLGAGLLAGVRMPVRRALHPVAVILLGVPAIAWVVLALLWFGGDRAVVFTVAVATGPIVFAAATESVRAIDPELVRMARVFRAPRVALLRDLYGPHLLIHSFPALATTFAMSWKIAVMAELFSGAAGIGDGIAGARARVDTAQTMAWVVVIVCVLVGLDHGILQRARHYLGQWRDDAPGRPR